MKTKILYVEDEQFLGKIVKESLESRNYDVLMIDDGANVMEAFRAFVPDVCVLDVMLPNKDGYAIGQEIRQQNASIPILFLTAKAQTEDVLKGFESGGNDYIKKPFSIEELIVRIQNLLQLTLGKAPLQATDSILLGKYEFIPAKYELKLNGTIKKLSHRETELLRMLYESRQYHLARKDILMKLWGDDSYFNSRNLDVYITKLRNYLDAEPSIQIITIKSVGYHFVM